MYAQLGDKFPNLASLYKDDNDSLYQASMNYTPESAQMYDSSLGNLDKYYAEHRESMSPEELTRFKAMAQGLMNLPSIYKGESENQQEPTQRFLEDFGNASPEYIQKMTQHPWEQSGWSDFVKSGGIDSNVDSDRFNSYSHLLRDEKSLPGTFARFVGSTLRKNGGIIPGTKFKLGGKLVDSLESEFKNWLGDEEDHGKDHREYFITQKDLGSVLPKFKYHLKEIPNLVNSFQKGGKAPNTTEKEEERTPLFDLPVMPLEIDGETIDVYIAQDDQTRERGLSGIDAIDEDEGMLFIFPSAGEHTMWMKDTKIPLDMLFMDKSGTINTLVTADPGSEELISGSGDTKYVLELAAGVASILDIQEGDKIDIDEQYQQAVDEGLVKPMKVLDESGNVQMEIEGGERIFSRKSTEKIIEKVKKIEKINPESENALKEMEDLGKYIAKEIIRQDERDPEYTDEEETIVYRKNGDNIQKEEV